MIDCLRLKSKEDILNYFKGQETVRLLKVDKRVNPALEVKLLIKQNANNKSNSPERNTLLENKQLALDNMGDSSIKVGAEDEVVTFKNNHAMGNGTGKEQRSLPQDKHDNSQSGVQHEQVMSAKDRIDGSGDTMFIPCSSMRAEINDMKMKLEKMESGSMEYMFMNLEYKMKLDNLRILERVNAATLNTTTTKQACDQIRVDTDKITKSLELTQSVQDQHQVTINNHSKSIQTLIDQLTYLEGTVEKQAQEVKLLREANDDQKTRSMKHMLYLHNIDEETDEKDKDTRDLVVKFFQEKMGIAKDILMTKVQREGSIKKVSSESEDGESVRNVSPRSILITLESLSDKGLIYNHVQNLKGKKNSKNKAYIVSDKLPAGPQEKKRYQNEVVKRLKAMPGGNKPNHKFKKGQLYIDGKKFYPAIDSPKVQDIVQPEDQDMINVVQLCQGDRIVYEGCTFTAYSQEVRSIDDICRGYIRVRQIHLDALHVSNAYKLPGTDVDAEDYTDDGEHGCGRMILRLLKEWNIECRAIYLVRNYGGVHLGTKRFNFMTDAVKSCVARSSYNSITSTNQYPWEEYVAYRGNQRICGGRGGRNKTSPHRFNSQHISPDKTYSDALTPNKKKNRQDPALQDNLVDQNAILNQQQMLTRAASAAISS